MRVLQLIDSLDAGGAERMAVNLANALVTEVEGAYLCTTRAEGLLKASLKAEVSYLFLKRKRTLDFGALKRLLQFVKQEQITVVHAHASSYFMATLLKLVHPKLTIIWHDHYGNSEFLEQRPKTILKWCSKTFKAIITVNAVLEHWDKQHLHSKQVVFLPNFIASYATTKTITKLKGVAGKRVLCLANLRPQKDHVTLLKGFQQVLQQFPEWTLHCVGKDFEDAYTATITATVQALNLEKSVFFYGSCKDTTAIIAQADIGVLASKSEGLPLALLEYGQGGLAVITTAVGDCHLVIPSKRYGELIPSENPEALARALKSYMARIELREPTGACLQNFIAKTFSEAASIKQILALYV
ncbi:glycosyltransferase [Winogradskyella wichelsiae]|uniref:glycosyltransferase n=1 Tax=Winogradskyella wichelsiae TaxID=2697007 RepID=UPI0015C835CB|nr:glycosyltransferase [Winogradskyella wichelsiae]